ncbi:hypothetical protein A4D02_14670 [Niastella koreensis]|uniref:Lipoprotein n=2 Tax=Niastella koreensis TaxID=354356 RepID=G8T880_NIAKG|nr:hypothetical protein [Niastella koreensis]AEV98031.1 hypothetical protein Niako_1664 [Niastella koreensis GR20-10]OQP40171.1 hypothetical protein A4D02_14670 [Niastella koreensis]
MKMQLTSKKVLISTGILLAIGVTTLIGCGESTAAAEQSGDSKEAAAATEKTAEKKWTELVTFKGSGIKKSAPFHLSGGKAKVKYDFKASDNDMGLFSFYVVPEGEDVMKDGGIPDAMTDKSESTETYITKGEGNYYISVNSANGNWNLTVEEEK